MAKIYLSHSNQDREIAAQFAEELRFAGHSVYLDVESIQPGIEWRKALSDALRAAEVILVLITPKSAASQFVMSEVGAARAYISSSSDKLLIPIVFERAEIPPVLLDIQAIFTDYNNLSQAITRVNEAISAFLGRRVAEEEKREERKAQIERTSASYIDETIAQLSRREGRLAKAAQVWNVIGWGSLAGGVSAAFHLMATTASSPNSSLQDWPVLLILGIKSVVIVALLIASARYAFLLAKSYMCESLKNADRIHAISFGKFFLQAYGDNVDVKDVKEVFQHWNITATSAFSALDADGFDPKIVEAILRIADVVKKGEEKAKKT
ncbi:MAG: toll/interleukin-1 receptor domain-containing protein [Nitrospirales bacterium]|nr:toll/interleukin-1 receptor domain-containing protein [Nitrospirales bacterium]